MSDSIRARDEVTDREALTKLEPAAKAAANAACEGPATPHARIEHPVAVLYLRSTVEMWFAGSVAAMVFIEFIWDLDEDPDGNVQHLLEHDVTKEEAEHVLRHPDSETTSDSSGRPLTFGYTAEGRHLAVVWEHVLDDPLTIYPVTAFDAKERA